MCCSSVCYSSNGTLLVCSGGAVLSSSMYMYICMRCSVCYSSNGTLHVCSSGAVLSSSMYVTKSSMRGLERKTKQHNTTRPGDLFFK